MMTKFSPAAAPRRRVRLPPKTLRPKFTTAAALRFEKFITPEPTSGCWLWTGGCDPDGYGVFRVSTTKQKRAHRFSFEQARGPVPAGLQLDHLCRVRSCVNPAHLEPVTNRTNTLRGLTLPAANAAKQFCVKGHPLYGPNLFVRPDGARGCRVCRFNVVPKKTARRTAARLELERWAREEVAHG